MAKLFTNQKQIERAIKAAVEQHKKWRKYENAKRNRRCGKNVARDERKKI